MELREYAPIVTRIGLSAVFLWFGISQLADPGYFLGYVPDALAAQGETLLLANGIFETVFGSLLLLGLFTRIAALLLGLHLLGIAGGLGYNDIAVRDIGLTLAAFSVALFGADRWTLDYHRKNHRGASP
ncbi:MAG TPA: DoxX family membrane protein [Candidatus Nanoarchaeia archaeon]|nr:DoxX family membrane protein [Candidatus Nanoarchaeia archaeon]